MVFTGRLSVQAQPWLADHVLAGTSILAGTAFSELAISAGDQVGCGRVEELTLHLPLVIPANRAVQVQVTVAAAGPDGTRAVSVHARPDNGGSWTEHASGVLAPAAPAVAADAGGLAEWPPPGAVPVPVVGLYEQLAGQGYEYGPAFRGLRAVWRAGEDVLAEVRLPEPARDEAALFGMHPALLDAVLHAAGAGGLLGGGRALVPFAWGGVSLHAGGASVVRARLRRAGPDAVRVLAVDAAGEPVITVDSLVLRPVTADQMDAARYQDKHRDQDGLLAVRWTQAAVPAAGPGSPVVVAGPGSPVVAAALAAAGMDTRAYHDLATLERAVAAGEPVPGAVLAAAGNAAADDAHDVDGGVAGRVLGLVQQWLRMDALSGSQLVIVTRGAVATGPGEGVPDLAGAPAWGLVRSARAENPGRVALADLDPASDLAGTGPVLADAIATVGAGEPEVAVRGGQVLARRLARPAAGELLEPPGDEPWLLQPGEGGTVDNLVLVAAPQAAGPLEPGQVRVAVRAAGVNFRDVLVTLGMRLGGGEIGGEGAGIVPRPGPECPVWPSVTG